LIFAAQNGHRGVVLHLLTAGAEVNAKNKHGLTAWDLVVEGGRVRDDAARAALRNLLMQFGARRS
jgi:ankyrin repeat protein